MEQLQKRSDEITKKEYQVTSTDGTKISVWRIAAHDDTSIPRPGVIHAHGGGFIKRQRNMRTVDPNGFFLNQLGHVWLEQSKVVLLYVEYRLATEKPFPAAANDVYSTFKWATDESNARKLGLDRNKIGLMGFSAGGNLALTAALMARDDGLSPPVCGLMLLYPMLDPDAKWEGHKAVAGKTEAEVVADKAFLQEGWNAYLGPSENSQRYARLLLERFADLPPTYLDVGECDYFWEEVKQLKEILEGARVDLTWTEWPNMPHSFEGLRDPNEEVAQTVQMAQIKRQILWQRCFRGANDVIPSCK